MTSLAALVSAYTRTPSATCYLDGRRWRGIQKLRSSQWFGEKIAGGTVEGRAPPVAPRIGMAISWRWGYNGYEVAGFTGEISDVNDFSYPDRYSLQVKDVLWRADKSSQVLITDPLNDITAKAAIVYLLTHYGGISSSRLQIPTLSASGSAWGGSEWVLGTQTPVAWGDTETESGGTTALKAAQEICSCLGYWLYADAGGTIRAKLMERKPSQSAREVFQRNVNLLLQGAPERRQSYESISNQVSVRGGNTGVEGSQIYDQFRTTHPLLPAGVYRDFPFSSFLIEYVNEAEAGNASATKIAQRILSVVSRIPDVIPLRAKADPNRKVGDTVGIIDTGVAIPSQRNFFIYGIDRELDLQAGRFDDSLTLDGGTGNSGFTTVPPPDASFSWRLMRETLDGDAVVEVFLDGSGSTSPSGEIVSWDWSTSTPTYGGSPVTASGETAVFIFLASAGTVEITLEVTDTTSKIGEFTATVDLTGADTLPPIARALSVAFGASWTITPDGGATVRSETSNGDSIAVGTYGAGIDDRATGTAGTYGMLATRGSGGAGGLRRTLDTLLTASTNLVSNAAAITSNIWVNEANPARVWFAIGDTLYRSTDGGATKTAMAKPAVGVDIAWVIEDPAVDDSVFVACGADLFNATAPTLGWALLYEGPVGAVARQFVRSRDGQATWVCYSGAPAGEALQRIENGAAADIAVTDIRTLALDKDASSLRATLTAITADDPAEIWRFDGLTGLSADQLAPTLPGGATAMHMLPDPDVDLYYIADFDSIAVGTGAVRKLIGEELLLMLPGATGQQAHMLGFGTGGASAAGLILLPYGAAGAADKLWLLAPATGTWSGITPPASGYYWFWIAACPFDTNKWLLLGNSGIGSNAGYCSASGGLVKTQDGAHSPLWLTEDAGATWTEIDLATPNGNGAANSTRAVTRVEWSATDGLAWVVGRLDIVADKTATIWRGSGSTASAPVTDTSTTHAQHLIPGMDEDVYFTPAANNGTAHKASYFDSADAFFTPAGSSIGTSNGHIVPFGDRIPLTRRVLMTSLNGDLYGAADYRAGQPTLLMAGLAGFSLAVVGDNAYIGSGTGVKEVIDPFGTPSQSTVFSVGASVGVIRSDRQTHTQCALLVMPLGIATAVGVFDGTNWASLTLPPDADPGHLYDFVEVLVTAS